ncbi:MAG: hypothetical protein M1541_21195 [Acidobacteria bacterium]|nr:hypothetical protein [Acidobacteriota bacterium]
MNYRIGVLSILILALLILGFSTWAAVNDPFFPGDTGARMHGARLPVVRIGNRIWLPVLQTHLCVLYRLHLPYYAFKCIPPFYLFLATLFIGLITWRLSGYSRAGLAFALLLMFCFAQQVVVRALGVLLYQEIIELALFYVLLWAGVLEGRRAFWVLALATVALLTRESFWIYLATLSLLNWKKILAGKAERYRALFLWSVPVLWVLSIPFFYRLLEGRFPSFPAEWPLGINKHANVAVSNLGQSALHLFGSLFRSRVHYLVAGLIVVYAIGRLWRVKPHPLAKRFAPFSLVSLGIVYALILLFDPWQATSGSTRIAIPLLAQGFVWAGLLFAESSEYPAGARILARGVLAAAMVLSMNLNPRTWAPQDNSQAETDQSEIARLAAATAGSRKPNFCFLGIEYFTALHRFVTPALYASRRFPRRQDQATPAACDVVITPQNATLVPGSDFARYKDYRLAERPYTVYHAINRRTGT